MKKYIISLLLLIGGLMGLSQASAKETELDDRNFEISKYLDIYNSLFRELDLYYVDTIKPKDLISESIDDMLGGLDPYTTFIPEEETKDLKFMITGEYGGIGSVISQTKKKDIIISEPYEGMPAQRYGLQAGDVITEVDGVKLKGKTVSDVSDLLKGVPGTEVSVTVKRINEKRPVVKKFKREKIQINPVSYYGVVGDKTGYILLNQFTDKAAEEVKTALLDLKNNSHIESLILDLRSNPGGLLDQAQKTANYFLPSGLDILYTRGKVKQWDHTYKTTEDPIFPNMPLVVLVNGNTASASEIVSGAFQDLDRAVIIGVRTFGKGLVQTTRDINYGAHIKVTTAKYYTPSNRCIQAIDYAHRGEDGTIKRIPDSLTHEFKTRAGRTVRDGGGIMPDIEVKNERKMNISYYLYAQNMIFDYATLFASKHKKIDEPEVFSITDEDYAEFKSFLKTKDFVYKLKSAEMLDKLSEMSDYEGYGEIAKAEFDSLKAKLTPNVDRDLDLFKKDIIDLINSEILKRYYYQKGAIRYSLRDDKELKKALNVLSDNDKYTTLLKPKQKD